MKTTITGCYFQGRNADGSGVFIYKEPDALMKEVAEIRMVDWVCIGPTASNEELAQAIGFLKQRMLKPAGGSR